MKRLLLFLCVLSLVLGITATALAQLAEIEPNDSFSQAQDLGTGDVSISNLEINPSGDVDYFRWTAGNDGDATFQIFFTHASGDLDLFLFDSSQTEIGISQSITDNEQIDQSVLAGEAYFLIVTGFGGATNTYNLQITGPGFPEPPAPDVIINEIMQNPSAVSDSAGEWFELFNPTAGAIDIDGWTISDNDFDSHVIDNGGPLLIPAGGFLVLGINGDSATNGGVTVDYQYAPNFFLGNSSDEVVLLDRSLNEIDRVEYDNGATFPDPNGASMALEDPALDNNVGANWCESTTPFGDGDRGTPGALNVCVPLNQPPVAICQDVTVPTDPGVCTAAVASVDGGSYDPDGDPISMAQSPASFDSLGDTPVILTATDDKGASASCNATVTVVDQEPPVPDVATLPEVSGECSVTLSAPTATDNCAGTITGTTSDPLSYTEEGTHTVTWTFDDANGNTSTQTQTVVVDDTTAPIPDVDPLPTASGECSAEITSVPTATDNCAGTITGTTSDPLSYTEEGTHTVTWTFDDGNGNIATQTQTVEVQDVTPPTISLSASPDTLWPPNHKMVPVSLDVSVSDNCSDPAIVLISVMSSEPDNSNGKGDGNTTNDIQDAEVGTEDYDISLRAERKGSGSGRIYTVTFEATDDSGNSTTASSNVLVPHDAR